MNTLSPSPVQELLTSASRRMLSFLNQSEDKEEVMADVESRFREAGVWDGSLDIASLTPKEFVAELMADNSQLESALENQSIQWNPASCESLGDLLTNLLS